MRWNTCQKIHINRGTAPERGKYALNVRTHARTFHDNSSQIKGDFTPDSPTCLQWSLFEEPDHTGWKLSGFFVRIMHRNPAVEKTFGFS